MILARRNLTYVTISGERTIPIEISTPEKRELGWCCPYSIAWPHGRFESEGYGFDALQALLLTMQKIGTEIYASEYHQSGKLRWLANVVGYGFPVPREGRDSLVGDDAMFFG